MRLAQINPTTQKGTAMNIFILDSKLTKNYANVHAAKNAAEKMLEKIGSSEGSDAIRVIIHAQDCPTKIEGEWAVRFFPVFFFGNNAPTVCAPMLAANGFYVFN